MTKKERILDAAIVEFAERGFVAASTNAIAERADVAKGLVFHHFGDKDALFLAAVAEIDKVIGPYFAHVFDDVPNDLVGRILKIVETRIGFVRDEPRVTRFLLVGLADAPAPIKKKARAILQPGADVLWSRALQGLDTSMLRVPLEDAVEAIMLLSAGIEKRNEALTDTPAKAKRFNFDDAIAHATRMLSMMRDGLYR